MPTVLLLLKLSEPQPFFHFQKQSRRDGVSVVDVSPQMKLGAVHWRVTSSSLATAPSPEALPT